MSDSHAGLPAKRSESHIESTIIRNGGGEDLVELIARETTARARPSLLAPKNG